MEKIKEISTITKKKKIVLFGETHGTKEIPKILSHFFDQIAKNEEFDIALEIPETYQNNIEQFFYEGDKKDGDGRNSLEYLSFIKHIQEINRQLDKDIRIFCIDPDSALLPEGDKIQQAREQFMADNILRVLRKKLFVITGNIHASKRDISLREKTIHTMGSILSQKLNNNICSILFYPKKGSYNNFGEKEISVSSRSSRLSIKRNFDYIYEIEEISPCSFLSSRF